MDVTAAAEAAAGAAGTDMTPLLFALSLLAGPAGGGAEAAETIDVVASERGFEPRVINLRKGDNPAGRRTIRVSRTRYS